MKKIYLINMVILIFLLILLVLFVGFLNKRLSGVPIYDKLKIPCLPVAINSGNVWPKEGLMRPNSTITISILKSIEPGLSKEEFLKKLENDIYTELDNLN